MRLTVNVAVLVTLAVLISSQCISGEGPIALARDPDRPIVYIEFDHSGHRDPVKQEEPSRGYWLRLVNNSVLTIAVRANSSGTSPEFTILPDKLVRRRRPIPRSGLGPREMPSGYESDTSSLLKLRPGMSLTFSVPEDHVTSQWYMQVPFEFDLPPVKTGVEPICFAPFAWEDIPAKDRLSAPAR
jgi:hypothetical protein